MYRLALLTLALFAAGCPHQGRPAPPPPTPETLASAALGVEVASAALELSADLAADTDPEACAILLVAGRIGHAVAAGLTGEISGSITYGELMIDARHCGDLGLASVDVADSVVIVVDSLARAIRLRVGVSQLSCKDDARVAGALRYLSGSTLPIVAALRAGELRVTIPALTVTPEGCE